MVDLKNREYRLSNTGFIPFKYEHLWELVQRNPTDKVEPKFKVGEWIIQENIGVYEVAEICESWYEVIDVENKHYSIGFDKEYMCHLWTIADAKEGDVLVCPKYAGGTIPNIFIFKDIDIHNDVLCYCSFLKIFFAT